MGNNIVLGGVFAENILNGRTLFNNISAGDAMFRLNTESLSQFNQNNFFISNGLGNITILSRASMRENTGTAISIDNITLETLSSMQGNRLTCKLF